MGIRALMVLALAALVSGCATTGAQKPSPITQLQTQVGDLEQRVQDQEKEIVDLKYEVKEVSGKVVTEQSSEEAKPKAAAPKVEARSSSDTQDLIKVAVAPSEIQKALKAAGVYEGKVDGKIGSRTKAAIIEFQKQKGLKADGVVGQKTWSELKQAAAPAAPAAAEQQ
ncbi:MAG: peptidoglycan-binding protein [Candidatus Omnitrophica bacterium]|nr:peptidoglycan-binding protein [Candidatus Omnitrophota bacterium]